jgi:A/G-specific adenine glycosylase
MVPEKIVKNSAEMHSIKKFQLPDESRFISDAAVKEFQNLVLEYYRHSGRKMAWRNTRNPYHILVSEIMLQQTQVDRVTVKYPLFIAAFPDFFALASAPLKEILAVWQGMGYNRRAIALQTIARTIVSEYDGVLPGDVDILDTFPCIGRATASSIAAFAFNRPVVFIETNIRRVFIYTFFDDRRKVSDSEILPLVDRTLYRQHPRIWYWALMDLGTALKKTVPDPNQRSVHYKKQAVFEGSDRKIRGMILRLLISGPVMQDEIFLHLPEDPARINRIIAALEKDGFIIREGRKLELSP